MTNIVTVNFRGDTLYGFEGDDGVFVAMKPIVEAMGLQWSGQLQRVKRDPILSEGMCMMHTPFGAGGEQEVSCLKFDLVNGWLFTIETSRIKNEEVRKRVITYQRECYSVLAEHFQGKQKPQPMLLDESEVSESEGTRLRMVTESRQTFGTQAAAQLWFQLGLPVVPAMLERSGQLTLFDAERIKHAGTAAA